MRHLTPYGQSGQRFREVDPQEMQSLMRVDASAYLTEAKTAAILAALAHAFPGQGIRAIEYRIHSGGQAAWSWPKMRSELFGGLLDMPEEGRKHTKGATLDTWVTEELEGGDANNLFVVFQGHREPGSLDTLDALPSRDDYFYTKVSYYSYSGRTPVYVVCDGMRGLLDLVGSLGRGDI